MSASGTTTAGTRLETIWEDRNGNGQVYHIGGVGMQEGYKSGPVPTQEMVDAYPTNKGSWILDLSKPYLNVEHTQPNVTPEAIADGYSESDPYSCFRDPRFYASIYYHGSKRYTRWSFAEDGYEVNTFRTRTINCSVDDPWTGADLKANSSNKRQRTRTGYYSRKYLNPTKNPTSPRNDAPGFKHFRFAEIILNYAEAAAEAGHTSDALEALKEIRDRVAMPHITTTDQAALIREIRAERRIELFFEEHRFFDIRRWQQPDGDLEDILHYTTAMQIDEQNGTYTYQRVKIRDNGYACYTNKFLFLPLPLAEASRLESITGMKWQNPGW
ncbi:MAG: RagB/SusD family nutrient uptake outer membrane protein [Alistipes sp.]